MATLRIFIFVTIVFAITQSVCGVCNASAVNICADTLLNELDVVERSCTRSQNLIDCVNKYVLGCDTKGRTDIFTSKDDYEGVDDDDDGGDDQCDIKMPKTGSSIGECVPFAAMSCEKNFKNAENAANALACMISQNFSDCIKKHVIDCGAELKEIILKNHRELYEDHNCHVNMFEKGTHPGGTIASKPNTENIDGDCDPAAITSCDIDLNATKTSGELCSYGQRYVDCLDKATRGCLAHSRDVAFDNLKIKFDEKKCQLKVPTKASGEESDTTPTVKGISPSLISVVAGIFGRLAKNINQPYI